MGKKIISKRYFYFPFVFTVLPSDFVPDRNISFFLPAWLRVAGEVKLSEANYVKERRARL